MCVPRAWSLRQLAYVGESVTDPAKYWHNNVTGTINLLDALTAANAPPMVFSSSCTVYGMTDADFIAETVPVAPINPYGNTKRAIEIMLQDYEVATGLRHIVLRYLTQPGAMLTLISVRCTIQRPT